MSRSSVANRGLRVAIVGASTLEGTRIREQLERVRIPGERVNLFGESGEEVAIGEYAGEARIVQQSEVGDVAGHDVVFLCERSEVAEALSWRAPGERVILDLVGALPDRVGATMLEVATLRPITEPGFYGMPHPIASALTQLLTPIERAVGIEEATAVVMQPAADFGDAGVQELREQTVRLLNFLELPIEHFGRQLAFNVMPSAALKCGNGDQEQQIQNQLTSMLGWERPRASIRLVASSHFFGHAMELRVKPRGGDETVLGAALQEAGLIAAATDAAAATTPMDVADEQRTVVERLSSDGMGGYWMWVVAGGATSQSARIAVDSLRDYLRR